MDQLFTRDEVLGGLPSTRRLRALLYLIESRTAHLAAGRRRAMERFRSPQTEAEDELAFLEAFALGRDPPIKPTIQDLERYAPLWAGLAPEPARLRAGLAHLFGQKYSFFYHEVPSIRQALALDSPAVESAFERQYNELLKSIYSERQSLGERIRWAWSSLGQKLEDLPPFWTAFAITLTETVGATILAMPIALAGIGPLAGIVLLVTLGLVNALTIFYMAEAMARTGSIRYEQAYLGRLVTDYLGRSGQVIFTVSLALLIFLALLAYYFGFSISLASATQIRAEIWAAVLFFAALYFLLRKSINATVASALLIGVVNIVLVLALSGLALMHFRLENLLYMNVPFLNGQPFDAGLLQLVFGVVLAAFFGHSAIANGAALVLQREPSGRALMTGSVSAQFAAIVLYVIWLVAIGGAIPASRLVSETGTALIPLAAQVGPSVHWIGSLFVILGMGMASIHFSISAFNLVREWLPHRRSLVILLPRRRGRLIFGSPTLSDSSVHFCLAYLGLDGELPRMQLEVKGAAQTHVYEAVVSDFWEPSGLFANLPGMQGHKIRLTVQVLEAQPSAVRIHVDASLPVRYEDDWETGGMGAADLLAVAPAQRGLVQWLLRQGDASLPALARHLDRSEAQTRLLLQELEKQGFVQQIHQNENYVYRVKLAPKRSKRLPREIWQALEERSGTKAGGIGANISRLRRSMRWLHQIPAAAFSERGRFLLGIAPVVLIFLLVEWMFLTQRESFTAPLNYAGVLVISLLGSSFPALLLVASRRKADLVPGFLVPAVGRPVFTIGIYLLGLANLFIHGLVIWEHPVYRGLAVTVGVLMLAATWRMARSRIFAPRAVLELRAGDTPHEPAQLSFISNGRNVPANIVIHTADGMFSRQATGEISDFAAIIALDFSLPDSEIDELKVWVHRVNRQGDSEAIPAWVDLHQGAEHRRFNLQPSRGQVLVRLREPPASPRSVRIFLKDPGRESRPGTRSEVANAGD